MSYIASAVAISQGGELNEQTKKENSQTALEFTADTAAENERQEH